MEHSINSSAPDLCIIDVLRAATTLAPRKELSEPAGQDGTPELATEVNRTANRQQTYSGQQMLAHEVQNQAMAHTCTQQVETFQLATTAKRDGSGLLVAFT
jgi:hypothetical protein